MRRGEEGLVRRFSLVSLLAAVAIVAAPAGASAATQIGQTFDPSFDCRPNVNFLQSASPGPKYAASSDGVITSWSFQAPATGTDLLEFKLGRSAGGGNVPGPYPGAQAARFKVVGEGGGLVDPAAGTLNTYATRIPAFAGDLIGFYWNAGNTAPCSNLQNGFSIRNHDGDVPSGSTAAFTEQSGYQLDISAMLEPDCDKDGLGDETQDKATIPCPTCKGQPATIIGTPRRDVRAGTPGRDVMVGLGGNDKLNGAAGNDLICGGPGKDVLNGGKGNDKLFGEAGKDTLRGGPGKDKLSGGPGKDKQTR